MSSGHISRDGTFFSLGQLGCGPLTLTPVSAMKKRLEKEAMEQDDDHWLIHQCPLCIILGNLFFYVALVSYLIL